PLDLLLHLIKRDQINVYDIPVVKICESYLEYLRAFSQPDVNLAGEFFVMAATLLQIKSQMLLPREEIDKSDDPRLPLVAQLLEYERFKQASQTLDQRPWLDRDVYARPLEATLDVMPVESLLSAPIDPVDPFQVLVCLKIA